MDKPDEILSNVLKRALKHITQSFIVNTDVNTDVLDCIGFLRHFLHFFHRSRIVFLNAYQELVLSEPDSAVSQPLKEVFLALRRAAEAGSE